MGILDKLRSLFKKEETEEQKFLIDVEQSIKLLEEPHKILYEANYKGLILNDEDIRMIIDKVYGSLNWLKEARRRVPVIEKLAKDIEDQIRPAGYRIAAKLEKEEEQLFELIGKTRKDLDTTIHRLEYVVNNILIA